MINEKHETFSADDFLNRSVKDMRPDEQPREKTNAVWSGISF